VTLSLQWWGGIKAPVLNRLLFLLLSGWITSATPAIASNFAGVFDEANKARAEGRFDEAEQQYREALSLSPDNADVMLQLGIVLGYLERYEEALGVLSRGIAMAPDYIDLHIAAARIKGWMGRLDEAEADIADILAKDPGNIDAQELRQQQAKYRGQDEKLMWRLDTGYDQSRFNRVSRKDWHEEYIQVTLGTKQTQAHLRAERSRRFGEFDTYVRTGASHRLNDDLGGYINFGITPAASFLPRWKAEAGVDYRLLDGGDLFGPTIVKLDLAQKNYASGDIRNVDPGLQQYLIDGRAWLTGRWINTYDLTQSKRLPGWSFRADWQALETLRLFGGIASAAEIESGTSVNTLSRYAGASFDVTSNFGVNFAFTRDNRKNAYIRDVFSGGMSLRF